MTTAIFVVLLVFGIVILLGSLLFGELFSAISDADFSNDSHAGAGSDGSGFDSPSWFSLQVITAGIVGFAAFGLLALSFGLPGFIAWIAAPIGFVAMSVFVRECIYKPLLSRQYNSLVSRQSYIGRNGVVTLRIPAEGFGEVLFNDEQGVPVRSMAISNGQYIAMDTHVRIIDLTDEAVVVTPEADPFLPGGN